MKMILKSDIKNQSNCIKIIEDFSFDVDIFKSKLKFFVIIMELLDLSLYKYLEQNKFIGYTISHI